MEKNLADSGASGGCAKESKTAENAKKSSKGQRDRWIPRIRRADEQNGQKVFFAGTLSDERAKRQTSEHGPLLDIKLIGIATSGVRRARFRDFGIRSALVGEIFDDDVQIQRLTRRNLGMETAGDPQPFETRTQIRDFLISSRSSRFVRIGKLIR